MRLIVTGVGASVFPVKIMFHALSLPIWFSLEVSNQWKEHNFLCKIYDGIHYGALAIKVHVASKISLLHLDLVVLSRDT